MSTLDTKLEEYKASHKARRDEVLSKTELQSLVATSQGFPARMDVGKPGDEAGKIEGRGLVSGDFGDAMLRGGTMIGEPKLDEKPRQEGSVRINIVVDASGSVIQAVPDYQSALTTIRDSHHVQLALRAAKTAKFDSDATKPRRSGYITIRFDLE